MNPNRTVPTLFTILAASKATGLNYETIFNAIASGRLRVRAASNRPNGFSQPLIATRDLERYVLKLVEDIRAGDNSTLMQGWSPERRHRLFDRVKSIVRKMPSASVTMEEILRPRPARQKRTPRRKLAQSSS